LNILEKYKALKNNAVIVKVNDTIANLLWQNLGKGNTQILENIGN